MSEEHSKRILMIFAREPEAGRVKTRLAKDIGPDLTLELYKNFLLDTIELGKKVSCHKRYLFTCSNSGSTPFLDEFRWRYEQRPQKGEDLGERMVSAFSEVRENPADRILVIGTDCLELDVLDFELMFEKLETHDAVIGPSEDGGYYALGLRVDAPLIFQDIQWGGEKVLSSTLERINSEGLNCALAPGKNDIDTLEDLRNFAKKVVNKLWAPYTTSALRAHGAQLGIR